MDTHVLRGTGETVTYVGRGALELPHLCFGLDPDQPHVASGRRPLLLLPVRQEPSQQPVPLVHLQPQRISASHQMRSPGCPLLHPAQRGCRRPIPRQPRRLRHLPSADAG